MEAIAVKKSAEKMYKKPQWTNLINDAEGKVMLDVVKFYQSLDFPTGLLFKREVSEQLKFSETTFRLRIKTGRYRPGELSIVQKIITDKTYLK